MFIAQVYCITNVPVSEHYEKDTFLYQVVYNTLSVSFIIKLATLCHVTEYLLNEYINK